MPEATSYLLVSFRTQLIPFDALVAHSLPFSIPRPNSALFLLVPPHYPVISGGGIPNSIDLIVPPLSGPQDPSLFREPPSIFVFPLSTSHSFNSCFRLSRRRVHPFSSSVSLLYSPLSSSLLVYHTIHLTMAHHSSREIIPCLLVVFVQEQELNR